MVNGTRFARGLTASLRSFPDCLRVNFTLTKRLRIAAHDGRIKMFAFSILFRDGVSGETIRPF